MSATASKTRQVTMDGTAHELTVTADPDVGNGEACTVLIVAPAAADMFFGYTSGVTTGTGCLVAKGTSVSVALGFKERVWGIGASGFAAIAISRF